MACFHRTDRGVLSNGDKTNMSSQTEPTFKSVFGSDWANLPVVMRKHYANQPYSDQVTRVDGIMDVFCNPPLIWLAPIIRWMGQIPARNEKDVPVTVYFESKPATREFHFKRIFYFTNHRPYIFHSRMIQTRQNEMAEIMKWGLVWKLAYSWNGKQVILTHRGYAIKMFNRLISLPITFLIGKGHAVEWAIDESTFDMEMHITHPLWGRVSGYKGRFKVIQ